MTKLFRLILPLLLLSTILQSCSEENRKENISGKAEDTLPHIKSSTEKLKVVSKKYIAEKKIPIEHFVNKYFRNENSSLSLLVAKNGQIIYEKYQGDANRSTKQKITEGTPMHLASVSKVLTATAIMILIDAGKIQLDQNVHTILNKFPYDDVTIESLLTHRSGLQNYAYFTSDKSIWDTSKTLTNEDVLNLLGEKNISLNFKPNTHFAYCNTNYAILALVIEKVTGLSYKDALKRMIFEPLGMTDTYVFDYEKDKEAATQSYMWNNNRYPWDFLDKIYGDKNIYSTPRDLLKFDLARNAPTFLTSKLKKKIYKGYSYENDGTKNYGLGIRMIEWKTGQKYYFHNGWWHGNTTSYITLPHDGVTIIALSNKFSKNVYAVRKLAPLFGDYPFKFDNED